MCFFFFFFFCFQREGKWKHLIVGSEYFQPLNSATPSFHLNKSHSWLLFLKLFFNFFLTFSYFILFFFLIYFPKALKTLDDNPKDTLCCLKLLSTCINVLSLPLSFLLPAVSSPSLCVVSLTSLWCLYSHSCAAVDPTSFTTLFCLPTVPSTIPETLQSRSK